MRTHGVCCPGQTTVCCLRHVSYLCKCPNSNKYLIKWESKDQLETALAKVQTRATKGCFDVTSNSESLSDQFCQKTRSPYETLRRDEHLGPNEMSF